MARLIETITEWADHGPDCKTAAQMEIICCEKVPKLTCCEVTRPWSGYTADEIIIQLGIELDNEGRDSQGRYVYIEFEPRKHPCGEILYDYDLSPNNCCDDWVPIAISTGSTPDVLPAGGAVSISWAGGIPPFTVRTSSAGTWLPGGFREVVTDGRWCPVYAGPTFCGTTVVTIRDACGSATWVLRSTLGRWERFYPPGAYCLPSTYTVNSSGYEVATSGAVGHVQESVCGGPSIYPGWKETLPGGGAYFIPPRVYYDNRPAAYQLCVDIEAEWCATQAGPWPNPGGTVTVPGVFACRGLPCWLAGEPSVQTSWQGDRVVCGFTTCGTFRDEYYRWVC